MFYNDSSVVRVMEQEAQTDSSYHQLKEHVFTYNQPLFLKTWCLYAKRRGIHSQTNEQYHEPTLIATIKDLQQFFLYYTSIKLPSQCEVDIKVMLFQENCEPSWQAWPQSGSLLIQFKDSKDNNDPQLLDQIWEYLVLSMVGNRLDEEVIGICLNKHQKQTLIEVWLRRLYRKVQIGQKLEKMMEIDLQHVLRKLKRKLELKYTQHRQSIKKQSTMKCAQSLRSPAKSLTFLHKH